MKVQSRIYLILSSLILALSAGALADDENPKPTVGIIGTGDMGDSLGKDRRIHDLSDCALLLFSRFGSDGGTSLRVGEGSTSARGRHGPS